jgi:hypothetical protein
MDPKNSWLPLPRCRLERLGAIVPNNHPESVSNHRPTSTQPSPKIGEPKLSMAEILSINLAKNWFIEKFGSKTPPFQGMLNYRWPLG